MEEQSSRSESQRDLESDLVPSELEQPNSQDFEDDPSQYRGYVMDKMEAEYAKTGSLYGEAQDVAMDDNNSDIEVIGTPPVIPKGRKGKESVRNQIEDIVNKGGDNNDSQSRLSKRKAMEAPIATINV